MEREIRIIAIYQMSQLMRRAAVSPKHIFCCDSESRSNLSAGSCTKEQFYEWRARVPVPRERRKQKSREKEKEKERKRERERERILVWINFSNLSESQSALTLDQKTHLRCISGKRSDFLLFLAPPSSLAKYNWLKKIWLWSQCGAPRLFVCVRVCVWRGRWNDTK